MKVATALFAALCLMSCSTQPSKLAISEPRIVRVPGATRYVEIPTELTDPLVTPSKPVPLCMDKDKWPVLCDSQIALWIRDWEEFGARANVDRAAITALPLASPEEGTLAGQ